MWSGVNPHLSAMTSPLNAFDRHRARIFFLVLFRGRTAGLSAPDTSSGGGDFDAPSDVLTSSQTPLRFRTLEPSRLTTIGEGSRAFLISCRVGSLIASGHPTL